MGSCVSLHKDPDAALKVRLSFRSKNHKLVIPSPVKDAPPPPSDDAKPHWSTAPPLSASQDFGSIEESFFDTNVWLESDCEDDFLSVNGDFTPSRGSTPVHHKFSTATKGVVPKPLSEPSQTPSPTDKKKRLSELFSESGGVGVQEANGNVVGKEEKSATDTPYASGASSSVCSSERSTNSTNLKSPGGGGQKQWKQPQCCLPRLRYNRTFSDGKKMESPVAVASVG